MHYITWYCICLICLFIRTQIVARSSIWLCQYIYSLNFTWNAETISVKREPMLQDAILLHLPYLRIECFIELVKPWTESSSFCFFTVKGLYSNYFFLSAEKESATSEWKSFFVFQPCIQRSLLFPTPVYRRTKVLEIKWIYTSGLTELIYLNTYASLDSLAIKLTLWKSRNLLGNMCVQAREEIL